MSSKFEKSVKGATKIKLAAPKSKYVEHILVATHTGEAGVAEIFRTLHLRLRDSTWTVVFKALIVAHFMVREGQRDATLQYLAENPKMLAISGYSEVQTQGHNIRRYTDYLVSRARAYEHCKIDHVRNGQGRMRRLTVEKGLLRETEVVQKQIKSLLRCEFLTEDVENEITLTAFRLLTLDLLSLYSVMNEGTINVLEQYFEMSRPDSERALQIYKTFTTQTEEVVRFLGVARHFEAATKLEIPKLKHASTDLTRLLEDDLNDPDFDLRRREYLAQKEAKRGGRRTTSASNNSAPKRQPSPQPTPARPQTAPKPETKPDPQADLIDFFDSIEPNQPTMGQQNYMQQNSFQQQPQMQFQQTGFQPQQQGFYQQTGFQQQPPPTGLGQSTAFGGGGFQPQNINPFGQQQVQPQQQQPFPNSAGGGFGSQSFGFQSNLSAIPQNNLATFSQQQQPQPTNPFRQSMLMSTPTGSGGPPPSMPLSRQETNPFAKRLSMAPQYTAGSHQQFPPQAPQPAQPLQPQRTGTNPFARNSTVPPQQPQQGLQPLQPTPTGRTNPFRQSALIHQQTGQGWQTSGPNGSMGGLEQLETIPIFPRSGMM